MRTTEWHYVLKECFYVDGFMQRHKNVMRELAAIQKQEVFRFDQLMQKKVQNPYTGVGFGGQRVLHSPSSRARINAPDYSTDDALYSGGEDSSMKD